MGFFSRIKNFVSGPTPALTQEENGSAWQREMLEELSQTQPSLSAWLEIIFKGQAQPGEELWERLKYFLNCVDTPDNEAEVFLKLFKGWVEASDTVSIDKIKAALGHRLALALDMEEQNVCRADMKQRLCDSLARTREKLAGQVDHLLGHEVADQAFWDDLTEAFILADVGHTTSLSFADRVKKRARRAGARDITEVKEELFAEMDQVFREVMPASGGNEGPEVVLMVGVNGVGKTTTVAKLAHRAKMRGKKVLIAAADTFRAAAIEQLEMWAKRIDVDFFSKNQNADPAAVAYEAVDKAVKEGHDLVLIDTAGRLHTKANLMEELAKINRVIGKRLPGAPHRAILVLDATTGQNALSQVCFFQKAVKLTEVILTKLDGTAKGGVVLAVAMQFNLPVSYIGMGEQMEDLRPFEGRDFAAALLGL